MSHDQFLAELMDIFAEQYGKTIPEERYYRKLLSQLEKNSTETLSGKIILQIFRDSLNAEPIDFDKRWNEISESTLLSKAENLPVEKELELAKNTVRFFVAELRQLGTSVLSDPHRGLGVTSRSGSRWYNFDITSVVAGYAEFCNDAMSVSVKTAKPVTFSWNEISDILLFGKGYE